MKIEFNNENELIYFNNLLTESQVYLNAESEIEFGDKVIVDFGPITEPYYEEYQEYNGCEGCEECYEALMKELDEKQDTINTLIEVLITKLRKDIMC